MGIDPQMAALIADLRAVLDKYSGPPADGAHYAAAFPLVSNPQDVAGGAQLTSSAAIAPGSAKMVGPLPDPLVTPGFCNPAVTDATIKETIGTPNWTAKVRPPVSYTDALKRQQMVEYGYPPDTDPATLEEDHLVPLCAGGHPTDPRNLWPQPRTGPVWNARVKDLTEVAAQHAILNGHMSLEEVRQGFMTSWVDLHTKLFTNPAIVGSLLAAAMEPPQDEP